MYAYLAIGLFGFCAGVCVCWLINRDPNGHEVAHGGPFVVEEPEPRGIVMQFPDRRKTH